ncbi:MAG: hypothetical protein M1820_007025 [Bogoriella megaspora]|nr:MAG: hypothetical protein M1820_007025 [Bogoriella megaspora]
MRDWQSVANLEDISQEDARRGVCHLGDVVPPDFARFLSTERGVKALNRVSEQLAIKIRVSRSAAKALLVFTCTMQNAQLARMMLTQEYCKTYRSLHTPPEEWVSKSVLVPMTSSYFTIGPYGESLAWAADSDCFITVDWDAGHPSQFVFELKGSKQAVDATTTRIRSRVLESVKSTGKHPGNPSEINNEERSDVMRNLMRGFPHPVAVVTATPLVVGRPELTLDEYTAITISSMTTVSLSPVPIITFNILKPSRSLSAIYDQGKFTVQLLRASYEGAFIADAFTKGDSSAGYRSLQNAGAEIESNEIGSYGPTISGPGIRGRLLCKLLPEKCVEVSDHAIVVAEVEHIYQSGSEDNNVELPLCLGYQDGMYRKPGISIPSSRIQNISRRRAGLKYPPPSVRLPSDPFRASVDSQYGGESPSQNLSKNSEDPQGLNRSADAADPPPQEDSSIETKQDRASEGFMSEDDLPPEARYNLNEFDGPSSGSTQQQDMAENGQGADVEQAHDPLAVYKPSSARRVEDKRGDSEGEGDLSRQRSWPVGRS